MEAEPYLVNEVSDEDIIKHLRALADQAARFGITSMQIMSSMSVERFARLLVKADLPIRIRAIPFPMTTVQGRDLSEIRQLSKLRFPDSKVTVSGIKWISTVATNVVDTLTTALSTYSFDIAAAEYKWLGDKQLYVVDKDGRGVKGANEIPTFFRKPKVLMPQCKNMIQ